MPLSTKTKNLLDLYARLANEEDALGAVDDDTLTRGAEYAYKSHQWAVLARVASALAGRNGAVR